MRGTNTGVLTSAAVIPSALQPSRHLAMPRFPESKMLKKFSLKKKVWAFSGLCEFFLDAKSLEVSSAPLEPITSITNILQRVIGDLALLSGIQHDDLLTYRKALLTGDIINPAISSQIRSGRMPSTVNKQMSVLSEILKLANRSQFIVHAPYEGVTRLKLSKREPDPLSVDEFQALVRSMSCITSSILIFSAYAG